MTAYEKRTWWHIAIVNGIALLLGALAFALAGCDCPARVVAEVTTGADGGTYQPADYCADECVTSADCAAGMHCSLHPEGQSGLCFKDFNADGGR